MKGLIISCTWLTGKRGSGQAENGWDQRETNRQVPGGASKVGRKVEGFYRQLYRHVWKGWSIGKPGEIFL